MRCYSHYAERQVERRGGWASITSGGPLFSKSFCERHGL